MIRRNLYQQPLQNPIRERFWELGGEEPDWGTSSPTQRLDNPVKMAARELICAVVVKDIATRIKNKELMGSASGTIDAWIDDYCGTPPRRKWPFPGPSPFVLEIVAELSLLANSLQPGGLRNELEDLTGKLIGRTQ
jgi:hypothetical protein